ncbi:MAG: CNNM domain-containing protein [Planctomycetia bacterium]|nr:CNNM domain-containing protein [Planctomycetia bacterium]
MALTVSAFCSVAETVLLSLSLAQIEEISKKAPKVGKIWKSFKEDIDVPITAILALNTTAHTMGATFGGASFAKIVSNNEWWVLGYSIAFTFCMLKYTEILPKTYAARHNYRLALVLARPLSWMVTTSKPLCRLISVPRLATEKDAPEETLSAVTEISLLTSLAHRQQQLDAEQEKIILGALKLSQTAVDQIKVPINETVVLSDDMTTSEALEIAQSEPHTRFPVTYDANSNIILGYVNVKELLGRHDWAEFDPERPEMGPYLNNFVRELIRFDVNKKASEALNELVILHEHLALVVDSSNRTVVGIITLEDIVEELVGEIEDEFDRQPETLIGSSDSIRVGGGVPMTMALEKIKDVFPEEYQSFLDNLSEEDKKLRFGAWFVKRAQSKARRNLRVDCGSLAFIVRRQRRDQVFDAQILKQIDVESRVLPHEESVRRSILGIMQTPNVVSDLEQPVQNPTPEERNDAREFKKGYID